MKNNYNCDWCGKPFSAGLAIKDILCPECLEEYRAEQHRIQTRKSREEKNKKKPDISISDIQSMSEKASKEKGKYISYGKIVAGMR